ncbi:Sensory box histidine kinase/response regulator [Chitinispirillum alkaliphilum]|nr:Sensory box histidine kinase/response regulator [Chitinispirillum alkaliphilum]
MLKKHYSIIRIVFLLSIISSFLLIYLITVNGQPVLLPLALFSVIGLTLTLHLVYRSLIKPLDLIAKSLDDQSAEPIAPLLNHYSRFSNIAKLIKHSFDYKQSLVTQIEERERAEDALKKSEALYRSVIETSTDAIMLIKSSGRIVFHNSSASALFEIEANKTPHCLKFISSEELRILRQKFKRAENNLRDYECTLVGKGDKLFPAEVSISGVWESESQCFIVIIKDITGRKIMEFEKGRLEEQFRVAHKMEAIGQLAGGISHDFNNVLGAISGYADIINKKCSSDEKISKYAQMIMSGASRASDLTNKLLTFSRRKKIQFIPIDVHHTLEDVADLLNHTVDKSITIECLLKAKSTTIMGDTMQVQNIFMNIAVNALNAMENGGVLKISTKDMYLNKAFSENKAYEIAPGHYLNIDISDNGCGMCKKTTAKIFEPFFTTKSKGMGTGLGLASVYGSVKSHNGYIDVTSRLGEGSTFSLYLPCITENKNEDHPIPQIKKSENSGKNILIIDDESFLCNALKEMLSWMGHTSCCYCDPFEAIEFYTNNYKDFHLIFLDLIMPGMNGLETYRMLKKINPDLQVIIASGYCLEPDRQELLKEGVNYILQKPFVSSQLSDALQKVMG